MRWVLDDVIRRVTNGTGVQSRFWQGSVKIHKRSFGRPYPCAIVWTWLDSNACAVSLYVLGGLTALLLGAVERHRRIGMAASLWPTFWFATGALLLVMAAGRASNVSDILTDIGRDRARAGGWYEVRRSLQAWVIGAVAAVWAVTVAVAVWRVPERRRRYLPTAIVVFTLVCFVGIRLVSLHQVDAALHNREVRGVTVGAMIEVGLLLCVVGVSAWRFRRSNSDQKDAYKRDVSSRPRIGPSATSR